MERYSRGIHGRLTSLTSLTGFSSPVTIIAEKSLDGFDAFDGLIMFSVIVQNPLPQAGFRGHSDGFDEFDGLFTFLYMRIENTMNRRKKAYDFLAII